MVPIGARQRLPEAATVQRVVVDCSRSSLTLTPRGAAAAYPGRVNQLRAWLRTIGWGRAVPLVLVPLMLAASNFPGRYQVPWHYWLAALTAAALFTVGGRWPLIVSLALSALAVPMFAAHAWGLAGLVPYLGAVGLAEAAMRLPGRLPVAVATAAWTGAVLVDLASADSATFWRPATAVEAAAAVGLPLLLGLYLRAQRELAQTYRARAADAEARRRAAVAATRTAERTALARELHDLVAHHMASIVLRIGVARHVVADADPQVQEVLTDVHRTAAGSLADIRRLLAVLRDPDLGEAALVEPGALGAEIAAAVDRTRAAGLTVQPAPLPDLDGVDAIGRLTLLRVVQESLTNAMKHADPAHPVTVELAVADGAVEVDVANRLAADSSGPGGQAHGLVGMAERVALVGGTMTAGPAGERWCVHARLPIAVPTAVTSGVTS